ncbi:hypothetical protein [Kurthia sibirica]|uniref:Lipoprotein n=1 Tax=Kurthia sibirica TaxID=202750 RepID=A0A2U3AJ49_9BACL|nr:hypothetical protein [Kurthia sibirica]PWI24501.1 hypothetical protein DEX24_12985 [Kurthia sibirica]GEK33565.1 hypothetical protein KSI01_10980 [Kurthia sibirica]
MKKIIFFMICLFTLFGCTQGEADTSHPPKLQISVAGKQYNTILGTYCWSGGCEDKVGPVDLLANTEPLVVKAQETITLVQKEKERPDSLFLTEIFEQQEKEIALDHYSFKAPTEVGTYYYGLSGTWFGEGKYEISGDAQYAFALKIER